MAGNIIAVGCLGKIFDNWLYPGLAHKWHSAVRGFNGTCIQL